MSQGIQGSNPGHRATDGRNIDLTLGTLSGEGSQQKITEITMPWQGPDVAVLDSRANDPTYYDRPLLKAPVWSWTVPAYYFVGGATGGAMVLGAAATLLNRDELSDLITQSRVIGVAGAAVSAVLLVYDLGKPSRFLNMLRVFRPTSPMNMGTWILVSFSGATSIAAAGEIWPGKLKGLGDAFAMLSGILGLALAGYTGVLISQTAVPLWQRPHRLMPPFFLSSGVTAAASLFDVIGGGPKEQMAVAIFGSMGKLVEAGCAHMMERSLATAPETARPLQEGMSGFVWKAAKVLTIASMVLVVVPGAGKKTRRVAGICGTLGSVCLRFAVHYAGNRSALNPRASFQQQRSGQGGYSATNRAAVTGPGGERAFRPERLS